MPVSPLLTEGVWVTSSGQIPILQQRPGEMKSGLDSHNRHDRGTRADAGKVAKWPCGGKRGQKGWNWRKAEYKSSQRKWREHRGQLKEKHFVLVHWRGVAGWKMSCSRRRKPWKLTLFPPRSSQWWRVSQSVFSSPNFLPTKACLQTTWYSIYNASELHLTDVSSITLHVSSSGAKFCKRLAS